MTTTDLFPPAEYLREQLAEESVYRSLAADVRNQMEVAAADGEFSVRVNIDPYDGAEFGSRLLVDLRAAGYHADFLNGGYPVLDTVVVSWSH